MGPGSFTLHKLRRPSGHALKWFVAACAAACLQAAIPAQAQSTRALEVRTRLQDSLQLAKVHDLDFGQIVVQGAGNVLMDPASPSSCTPDATLVLSGTCQPAGFEGTAETGRQIRLRLPPGRRIDLIGPGLDLRLQQMTIAPVYGLQFIAQAGPNYRFNVNSADGAFGFRVGGQLRVRANQPPGVYSQTFDIQLDYN